MSWQALLAAVLYPAILVTIPLLAVRGRDRAAAEPRPDPVRWEIQLEEGARVYSWQGCVVGVSDGPMGGKLIAVGCPR